ncbi:AAA family ATPase [Pseudanabaena biceps]|nr:AAA family ATPase [Pseudanabaena biceps]
MLASLSDYQAIAKIYESSNSQVYRGLRVADQLPVILKVLSAEIPTSQVVGRYRLEYETTNIFDSELVIKAYDFQRCQESFVIVLEDIGGKSLEDFLEENELSLTETLGIAIQICEAVAQIHAANVIHRDINPANIIINPETYQLKMIDFGIASVLPREQLIFDHQGLLEGTLAYISPEQTGRMNRSLDYRTDIYSMGITFYEMFVGCLPFINEDPLELIHHHLALEPIAPHHRNHQVPLMLSRIIEKLIAKNAEERYQSAWGVKADLEECLRQWQTQQQIEVFPLAAQDIADRFLISEKLYGRTIEVDRLLTSFNQVANAQTNQNVEMILISGYSGVGKSRLVHEIHRLITSSRGYFISGKFEQYQRDIPYLAIVQALQSLITQLLTESEASLQKWRSLLIEALGSNSHVITEIIPNLSLMIGKQPDAIANEDLSASESQNRFNLVFQKFIGVFAQPAHPLVIFLDDLQWADLSSLKLLQLLALSSQQKSLLLVGTYRDNEVNAAHPMMQMIEGIQQADRTIQRIHLQELNLSSINELIADTLHCSPIKALPLAELIQQKTGGNPFFMNEFLKSLYSDRLISFDYQSRQWQWSITQIQNCGITDNLVSLMAEKIQKLSDRIQQLLKIAACIGSQFDFQTIARLFDTDISIIPTIQEAIATGLILPLSKASQSIHYGSELTNQPPEIIYKFAHDRIQQAVYLLINEVDKISLHYRIGKILLQNIDKHSDQIEAQIFKIVGQFRFAESQITEQKERDYLAKLNLLAANRARLSYAYNSSVQYCQTGLQLLAFDHWEDQPQLAQELFLEKITAASLAGEFALVDQIIELVTPRLTSIYEIIKFVEVQIQSLIARNQLTEAIAIALNLLTQLGVDLPREPDQRTSAHLNIDIVAKKLVDIGNPLALPAMSDPSKLAAMKILSNIASAAYIGNPALYPIIVLKQVELSLEFGNTAETAYAFSTYGLILCVSNQIAQGNQAADIALALMERFQVTKFKAKIFNLIYHFVRPWQAPIREMLIPLLDGYQSGLALGDLEFAAYCIFNYCQIEYFAGERLDKVKTNMQSYGEAIAHLNQSTALNFHQIGCQSALNWLGESVNAQVLIGDVYNETERLATHIEAGDSYSVGSVYVHKLMLTYHFGNAEELLVIVDLAEKSIMSLGGSILFGVFYFYQALTFLSLKTLDLTTEDITISRHEKICEALAKLAQWADHAPANFAHRLYLVKAEMARVQEKIIEAMDLYDQAIALAKENQYIQEEALANELAAKFYLAQGRNFIAQAYMQGARYAYLKWGAIAKVQHLEKCYPQILESSITKNVTTRPQQRSNSNPSTINHVTAIDLETVIRSTQAIAKEIHLEQLLKSVMTILIESAGAQTGYLLLPTSPDLIAEDPSSLARLEHWRIEAIKTINYENVVAMQSIPLDSKSSDNITYVPISLIHYVARTQESIVLNEADHNGSFQNDPWIVQNHSKSLLCMPLLNQSVLVGIIFLENNLITNAFTPNRIEILKLISTQAATSILKARLLAQQAELNQALQAEISDRRLAEQERDRLITIMQSSTDIIGMSSPSGRVIWNNAQANRIRNLPPDADASKLSIPNYHPQWALEIVQKQGIPTAIQKGVWVGETAFLGQGGQEIPVSQMIIAHRDSDGNLEYFSTIMRDISEAKARESALSRSEATLKNLVAGTSAVTGADFFSALTQHIAEALEVEFAMVTQLIGEILYSLAFWGSGSLQPEMSYRPACTPCEVALRDGELICHTSVQQMFPDDLDLVTMQVDSYMGIALKDAEGNAIGNLCIFDKQPLKDIPRIRDILQVFAARASAELQRKTANEQIYELNQSLEARVKERTAQLEITNKELEAFSYSVSHDLRAPLRAVNGFARILQEDYGSRLDDEGKRYLQIVRDNATRMGELIDDLLNLSRWNRREISKRLIVVNDLINQVLADFKNEITSRNIELIIADLPNCQADISLLTQVWINLISNAIKYTGKVEHPCIEIGYQRINDKLTYFIRDNGAGFDMQYADKLFGVFQRMHLERDFEGTGIGLAIVYKIIQRHGGNIWAESALNQGATFYFAIADA